ncbi:MAG: FecR domain-containing protein [Odoribacter sp.]
MNQEIYPIAEQIYAYLRGTISDTDRRELEEWIACSEANRELFEQLKRTSFYSRKKEFYSRFDSYYDFKRIQTSIRKKKRIRLIRYGTVAAAVLIPLFVALLFLPHRDVQESVVLSRMELTSGQPAATLILEDGSQRELAGGNFTLSLRGTKVTNADNHLVYNGSDTTTQVEEYNTVVVPRGGEYQLALSDGSKVWLNSESSIRFPVRFQGENRRVTVSGEVYLDVAEDAHHPFVVNTRGFDIRVLGTRFNVRAYPDEEAIYATLEKGKIRIDAPDGRQFQVLPSEQLCYDKQLGQYKVKEVDTELYTSWKDGVYVFEKQTLENVLETISRWYDLTVVYADNDVKEIFFSGRIKRYGCADSILHLFEQLGGVRFEVRERIVTVQKE